MGSRKVNYKLRDWLFARQARQLPAVMRSTLLCFASNIPLLHRL